MAMALATTTVASVAGCADASLRGPCRSDAGCGVLDGGNDAPRLADAGLPFDANAGDAAVGGGGADAGHAVVLGDYAGALTTTSADGSVHIDVPSTLARLVGAHVNTYAYLVHNQTQWDDLPAFADAAAVAGVDVLVYLVPPTESYASGGASPPPTGSRTPNYPPYQWDYVAWAAGCALIRHPRLRQESPNFHVAV